MQNKLRAAIEKYRLATFLLVVVILAVVMVLVSVNVYYRSGAYQLDLSRPEYRSVRSQIEPDRKVSDDDFQASGAMSDEVLRDFLEKYQIEADRAVKADAFSADVLGDDQLGL